MITSPIKFASLINGNNFRHRELIEVLLDGEMVKCVEADVENGYVICKDLVTFKEGKRFGKVEIVFKDEESKLEWDRLNPVARNELRG